MSERVLRCTNSTITEAWALVTGLPAKIDETDASVVMRSAKEKFSELRSSPSIVAIAETEEGAPAFWRHQVSWQGDRYLARFGHRYLSVHFVRRDAPYDRYDTTMQPQVDTWLQLVSAALGAAAREQPIDVTGFGYVNTFALPLAEFDLSKYFRLSIGFDVGVESLGLLSLGTSVRFLDRSKDAAVTVDLRAEPMTDTITVTTKVFAETKPKDLAFADPASILGEVTRAKGIARDTFFGFVTDDTKTIMGAEYA